MGGRGAPKVDVGWALAADFEPNDWNPNRMSPRDYAMLTHDIIEFGFVDPVTVRPNPHLRTRFQIVDGENRWRVARDLGIEVLFADVGPIPDQTAKKLTVTLNELHGQYDSRSMGKLLEGLLTNESPEELLKTLPFTEEALAGMVGLQNFDWKGLDKPAPKDKGDQPAKWVERTFRMPPEADAVLQQALDQVRGVTSQPVEDWQALELIAADYLGT